MIVRICSDGTNQRGEMAASASDQSAPFKRTGAWLDARGTGRPRSPRYSRIANHYFDNDDDDTTITITTTTTLCYR